MPGCDWRGEPAVGEPLVFWVLRPAISLQWEGVELNRILLKKLLAPNVWRLDVQAPEIACNGLAGQFVMVMAAQDGERIPLTIADRDPGQGTITMVVQVVGSTTRLIGDMTEGDWLAGVAGPLGQPAHVAKVGCVIGVAGGIGAAPLLPIATEFKKAGNRVITVLGAKSSDMIIFEQELGMVSDRLIICTDDGSRGVRGMVTGSLQGLLGRDDGGGGGGGGGGGANLVVAVGPPLMMEACAEVTRPLGIKTMVSLNPIMVDGTGMCGGCRVTVGGRTMFTCVDGPEFDGHQVDFGELRRRLGFYKRDEKAASDHICRLNPDRY